jgi:hypothetical protein
MLPEANHNLSSAARIPIETADTITSKCLASSLIRIIMLRPSSASYKCRMILFSHFIDKGSNLTTKRHPSGKKIKCSEWRPRSFHIAVKVILSLTGSLLSA